MDLHSGTPFWPLRDGLPAAYPALRRNLSAEIVVLGAGITGALAAYELTRAGASVVVVDREDVASGSSAASSGLLLYETDTSIEELAESAGIPAAIRVYRLGLEAIDRIEQLSAELGGSCGFHRRPSVYLASTRRAVRGLERDSTLRRTHGFDVDFLRRPDLEREYSFTAPAAIRSRGPAEIDCYRFTHQLLAASRNAGAQIFDRTPVTRMQPGSSGVVLDLAGGYTLRASLVVCSTGYDAIVRLPRKTGNLATTWAFVSEPLDSFSGWADRCLIWETARPYLYLRSTDDGRMLAGGEDERGALVHERKSTFSRKIRRLLKRVRKMFPQLALEAAYGWAGTFATTDDGLPFIGELPAYPHVQFALCYGGNGITFSVIAARILRDAYLGRPNPDAALFGFTRPTALSP
jgi:glycine/D-amino acid oxidase-like deaminating enzyme